MLDRRQEDRRKEDRRADDQKKAKEKSISLFTLLLIIAIVIIITVFIVLFVGKMKNKKALESIETRHSNVYTCNLTLEGTKTKILPGETATFEIKASNVKAEDGIIMLEGLLDFDYTIFDCKIENIENGKWHQVSMLEDYFTMARNDLMPSSEDQSIGRLVIKAREQAQKGSYIVKLKNCIFTMEDSKDFVVKDSVLTIEVN